MVKTLFHARVASSPRLGGGAGRALAGPTCSFFEACFGRDLGGAWVHTDAEADRSTRELDALAYGGALGTGIGALVSWLAD